MRNPALLMIAVLMLSAFASSFTLKSVNAETGLVGYWRFEEGTGTTVHDTSGYGNTGTLNNGPIWVDGKFGKALSFDGTDDYVFISDSPSLRVTNPTVMAWVYSSIPFASQTDAARIVSKEYNSYMPGWGYGLCVRGSSEAKYPVCGLAYSPTYWAKEFYSSISPQEGYWHHIAFTYDHSEIRIYIDGEFDVSTPFAEDIIHSDWGLYIGGNPVASGGRDMWFEGKIDEVRIYNRALSLQEIQRDMRGPVGGVVVSTEKLGLIAPYIGLASIVAIAATASVVYVKQLKRKKEN